MRARRLVVMDLTFRELVQTLPPQLEEQLLAQVDLLNRAARSSDPRAFLRAVDMVVGTTEALDRLVNQAQPRR